MHLCKKFFLSHICIYLNFNRTRAFLRICLHLEVLDSSTFLLLAELFLTESEVKWSCIHHQTFFLSHPMLPVEESKMLLDFCSCMPILSELRSTNKWKCLFGELDKCICLATFHLKNWNSTWKQQKKLCVTICISFCGCQEKSLFFLNWMSPTRIWPLLKPTREKVDLAYFQ